MNVQPNAEKCFSALMENILVTDLPVFYNKIMAMLLVSSSEEVIDLNGDIWDLKSQVTNAAGNC